MRKFIILSLAATATVAVAVPAQAQAQADRGAALTRDQVQQRAVEAFARMDVNGDGVIDATDREARRERMFARLDANNDGSVSREEFAAKRERRGEARAQRGEARGERGMRPARGLAFRGGARSDGEARAPMTQEQFVASTLERFDRIDTNGDGVISAEERQAAREQMRRGGRTSRDS
jgi:Ca2+-binding EF-hand superfamily protein